MRVERTATAFSLVRQSASRPDSSCAQRHQESDVPWSIRSRCELAHRPAAPSARARHKVPAPVLDDAREESVSGACEPTATRKSCACADKLIDLVLNSSINDTIRIFAESVVLTWTFFLFGPLLMKHAMLPSGLRPSAESVRRAYFLANDVN